MKNSKITIVGVHGVGKSRICEEIWDKILNISLEKGIIKSSQEMFKILEKISEQFREVVKDIPNFTKQTEEITLATYAKQLYLENLYTAQCKNILCDRSALDTFVYYHYFNEGILDFHLNVAKNMAKYFVKDSFFKIYLIEPSDREIESDGFRLTDKKQQLEIHELFLEYFEDFDNVEIINQEEANKEEFIEKVAKELL